MSPNLHTLRIMTRISLAFNLGCTNLRQMSAYICSAVILVVAGQAEALGPLSIDDSHLSTGEVSTVSEIDLALIITEIKINLSHIDFTYAGGGCEAKAHEIAKYLES